MSSMREALYQIEVLQFTKNKSAVYHSDDVVSKVFVKDGVESVRRLKLVDTEPQGHKRTLFKRAKNQEIAKRWAASFGSILSCDKVDVSCYLANIEHLNLEQPIELVVEPEFILTKSLEIERPKRKTQGIEIIGRGIDKP
jgi:hypothetical protein